MNRLTHERVNGIKTGYWSAAKKDDLIQRLAEYENTGLDPEEIMDALKKQVPVLKLWEGDGYADGVMVYDTWYCQNCGAMYEETEEYRYCPNCGQALDWSELDEQEGR